MFSWTEDTSVLVQVVIGSKKVTIDQDKPDKHTIKQQVNCVLTNDDIDNVTHLNWAQWEYIIVK